MPHCTGFKIIIEFFKICYEALNENGFFRWNFGSAGNCPRLYELIQLSMENPQFKKFFTKESWPWFLYSIDEYREFLSPFAFQDLQLWEDRIEYVFPGCCRTNIMGGNALFNPVFKMVAEKGGAAVPRMR